MKLIQLVFTFLMIPIFSMGQSHETKHRVEIPEGTVVLKKIKVAEGCEVTAVPGTILKKEYKKMKGNVELTFTEYDTVKKGDKILVDKVKDVEINGLGGKANLSINEKDKTYLKVNYWLNKKYVIRAGSKIQVVKRILKCNGKFEDDYVDKTPREMKADSTVYLVELDKNTAAYKDKDWYKASDFIIKVFDENDNLNSVLVNKYDRSGDYKIRVENRRFISYKTKSFEFGALTIPFKQRFGFKEDGIKVSPEFVADANIGAFFAYKKGRYRVRYENGAFKELSSLSWKNGLFLNLSAITIDSLSTTAGRKMLAKDDKISMALLSPGFGTTLTLYNFDIGFFIGWDIGLGVNADNWNFNKKPWLGVGLGYKLDTFWQSD